MRLKAEDIRHLRTAARDYTEAEALKSWLTDLRLVRKPLLLSGADLDRIFQWKLGGQFGRQQLRRDSNPDVAYHAVTRAAFSIGVEDIDYELELRVRLLTALRGVGVPVASAILALADPERYCVIDFRVWRAAYGEDRRSFSMGDYRRYRNDVAILASNLGWSVQEVDLAIWEYDSLQNEATGSRLSS